MICALWFKKCSIPASKGQSVSKKGSTLRFRRILFQTKRKSAFFMSARKNIRVEDLIYLIDTREQTPFDFFSVDPRIKTEIATLPTGDYSIKGLETLVSIERKSLDDLIGCAGRGRERFERELKRLLSYPARCVVVEAPWSCLALGDYRSKITPQALMGSVTGWMEMGVQFFFATSPLEAARFAANFMFISARRRFRELQALQDSLKIAM